MRKWYIYSQMCYAVENLYICTQHCHQNIYRVAWRRCNIISARVHTWNFVAKMPKFIQTFYPFQKGKKTDNMCSILYCMRAVFFSIPISIDNIILCYWNGPLDARSMYKNSLFFHIFSPKATLNGIYSHHQILVHA